MYAVALFKANIDNERAIKNLPERKLKMGKLSTRNETSPITVPKRKWRKLEHLGSKFRGAVGGADHVIGMNE